MNQNTASKGKVKRFTKMFIYAHWIYAAAFFLLLLTGLPLFANSFHWVYAVFGGPDMTQIFHRIFAVIFVIPPIMLLLFDRKSLFHWLKEVLTWKPKDIKFFFMFPKEFLVGNPDMPKQGFYNPGEKLNSCMQIVSFFALVFSGLVLWFPEAFPVSVVQWSNLIHVVAFIMATTVVIGHIFLSAFHPNSKPSMEGITKGEISVDYAKHHHGEWYDELVEKGEVVEEDSKGA
ncbi:formate dehydrogenase subunit gamma [Texcoconibacillus texcoconensis]|uniref:Formate dehydrogenase subunit gamma n=1 Tax=Texcoconibacillus texcoconensis TaxID=1095777 RepID=A0A840QN79_9BACI|nr:cytochrome b/b6 domain-containing protein [Texcoconibacillus texcoconensis]MBB5172834.1 formate dehydrogenase subunit gamma [Texcoconibacillus texcoconensis]